MSLPFQNLEQLVSNCTTLNRTVTSLETILSLENIYNEANIENKYIDNLRNLTYQKLYELIYQKLYDFVYKEMTTTFDDIDDMLKVCHILLENKKKYEYNKFIMNCPYKFIISYVNNTETIFNVLDELNELGLYSTGSYLIKHIHESKLKILNERGYMKHFVNITSCDTNKTTLDIIYILSCGIFHW